MSHEKAERTWRSLRVVSGPEQLELQEDLIEAAIRYARIRVDWLRAGPDERARMETNRSMAHEAFIDTCNILSRSQIRNGTPADWRADLGNDRKEIGDFACFVHYNLGLEAR